MSWMRRVDREKTGDASDGEKLCHARCRKQSTHSHCSRQVSHQLERLGYSWPPHKRLMLKEIQQRICCPFRKLKLLQGRSRFPLSQQL